MSSEIRMNILKGPGFISVFIAVMKSKGMKLTLGTLWVSNSCCDYRAMLTWCP